MRAHVTKPTSVACINSKAHLQSVSDGYQPVDLQAAEPTIA